MSAPVTFVKNCRKHYTAYGNVAGETRFEHATNGFGDHYSTVEPLPYCVCIIQQTRQFVKYYFYRTSILCCSSSKAFINSCKRSSLYSS